jgi:lipoyl(octanoyl) transferase
MPAVAWRDLGRVRYDEALALQRDIAGAKRRGDVEDDVLLLLEHPPVITRGRAADDVHVVADPGELDAGGVSRVEVERGGDVTYHGPGQLVGYPILDLRRHREDLHWYLRCLEEVVIRTLDGLGVPAARARGLTGVWVGDGFSIDTPPETRSVAEADAPPLVAAGRLRKIASIGIHASRWVTIHGFALNHTAESLRGFQWIVPCGIDGVTMASIETEGREVDPGRLRAKVVDSFARVFGVEMREETDPSHSRAPGSMPLRPDLSPPGLEAAW